MNDEQVTIYLQNPFFVVQATSYEQVCLWSAWSSESDNVSVQHPVQWNDDPHGFLETVGHLADMPITVAVNRAFIEGQKVIFYYSPSVVTDWRRVEQWIDHRCAPKAFISRSDWHCTAENFHQCIHKIRRHK